MKYLKKKCLILMCICMISIFAGCGMNDSTDNNDAGKTENVNDVTGEDSYNRDQNTDGNMIEDTVDGIGEGVNDVVDDVEKVTDDVTDDATNNTTDNTTKK